MEIAHFKSRRQVRNGSERRAQTHHVMSQNGKSCLC
jgi:hypothetical protein